MTNTWRATRANLRKAKVIYIKSEILEFFIVVYFGGFNILKKVIAGVRSPWIYRSPIGLTDSLHNLVYRSYFMDFIMRRTKKIHVLNERDEEYMKARYPAGKVVRIPNYVDVEMSHKLKSINYDTSNLHIIFIGELLKRKGVDVIADVIRKSPSNYKFNIVGDGPMKETVLELERNHSNCKYHGYLGRHELANLLKEVDVLFFPSRAEGFGNVILEAMSFGVMVVDSPEIALKLPSHIELYPKKSTPNRYLALFARILRKKKQNDLRRSEIREYCRTNYSRDKIMPRLVNELFT